MFRKGAKSDADASYVVASRERSLLGAGGVARLTVAELVRRIDAVRAAEDTSGEAYEQERRAIRDTIRALVEESYVRQRYSLHRYASEIDADVDRIEYLAVVEGVSLIEIDRRYTAGTLRP